MRSKRFLVMCVLAVGFLGGLAWAQVPTGTLTGRVTDGREALPGVTVVLTAPTLQGNRATISEVSGDFIFRFLPPGDYKARFELQGFQTLEASLKITAAQTATLDAVMPIAQVTEEVTVTGNLETISTSGQVATTFEQSLVDALPVGRNLVAVAALTPGVAATGPGDALSISGAMSYENLYMVNGVVVTDNIRGTPNTLFIEDAIQETTTQTGAVSAEYGRFAGGVVNTLTKSGGNDFSGSLRVNLSNDSWASKTPVSVEPGDKTNVVYEGTLGGYALRDRLWFFTAGRYRELESSAQTDFTNIPYTYGSTQTRLEGKLTYALNSAHRVIASYMNVNTEETNNAFGTILDLASLDKQRKLPQDLLALNYSGVLSNSLFVEGQYSRRRFTFDGSGGDYTDLIKGTQIKDNTHRWASNSPSFCGVCDNERRNNDDLLLKGSYFASSSTLGSHDLVLGYDRFNDVVKSNNYQFGSNWLFWPTTYLLTDSDGVVLDPVLHQPIPVVYGDGSTDMSIWPIFSPSKGTKFTTNSIFVNDKWRVSNRLSVSLGLRYDKNDGKDASHRTVAKDDRVSPRLGLSLDLTGDGGLVLNASYGHYVTAVAGSIADQGAGSPSQLGYLYEGPDLNADCSATNPGACLNAHQILEHVFAWLFANGKNSWGGPVGRDIVYGGVSGISRVVGDNLRSPYSEEITIGASKRLGSKGLVRMDYIHRDYKDLYALFASMSTGKVEDQFGWVYDREVIGNTNQLKRSYDGVNLQASLRVSEKLAVGGNYTWSHAYGNYEGETVNAGPIPNAANADYYPEYQQQRWTNPKGDLSVDQRHRARVFAVWDVVNTQHHKLSVSAMESFFSGRPYEAIGTIRPYTYVTNPGYETPPQTLTYYFSKRGAYRTDDITRTDLSVNYAFKVPALGRGLEFYIEPEVTNLFNEQGAETVDTTVLTRYNQAAAFARLDPFTETPREAPQGSSPTAADGYHWQKGPNFGRAMQVTDFQTPRTFTLSFGVRF
ncbi:MAG TPA: TonB-dependent receptor [Thermoanaerobaculaceae bacterium]|nr:TonB-dependent receptor [Thermoanaerobaculaceae bacterium]